MATVRRFEPTTSDVFDTERTIFDSDIPAERLFRAFEQFDVEYANIHAVSIAAECANRLGVIIYRLYGL